MLRRVLFACLVLSACSAPQATPPSGPPSSGPSTIGQTATGQTTTGSVPPTTEGESWAQLQAKVRRAVIPLDGMADYGIPAAEEDEDTPNSLTPADGLCGKKLGFTLGPGRYRMFSGDRILVHNAAWAFQARTGKNVVELVAAQAAACTTWKDEDGFDHKIRTDLGIGQPAGVDAFFAYCDETADQTKKFRYCGALAARGNSLIEVATASHITRRETLSDLRAVLPRAIDRLLAA
ncbi:hypothetical protein KIPE111705_15475 [Kibdelosporangium persicum]|uniref:PknH-like extracellular domain-containing protein n=1 Tax=Kibdelosporangium persicum TaxID=2698649 RepID=A0ABX2F222_9PSEU|nr:hypothetical protein [Kibdelosporangium persicum]NRN65174.1 hypothetical protein [Kibdelosporangium persicum]